MDITSDFEEKTRAAGLKLYSGMSGIPPVFNTKRWMGRIMEWAMRDEDFKLRLFRFIDVLPSLRTNEAAVRVLRQYFKGVDALPKVISRALDKIPEKGLLPALTGPVIRKSVSLIARQFIAGNKTQEILKVLGVLQEDGIRFTIDLLGEVVVSDKEAREYRERYLSILDLIHAKLPLEADVSLKISSFYSQLDPVNWEGSIARSLEGLRTVLRKAKELNISVTFDMEHYYYKELTIAVFKKILEDEEFKEGLSAGIAVQTYLRDTERDIRELIRWARERKRKIAIRLVKGAYWDYEVVINRRNGWPVPVFLNKNETDGNFERLTRLLFENSDIIRPVIATHNLRSIAHAIAAADSFRVSKQDFEFQMLYGMAKPLWKALRKLGLMVRVYVPAGELIPGMAYLVRRLLENTSNLSFLRKSFAGRASFDDLMKSPTGEAHARREKISGSNFGNEPLLDFSIAENRKKMRDAITSMKEGMNKVYPLLIGDRQVQTTQEIASRNPARPNEPVRRVWSATKKQCDVAMNEALKVHEQWKRTDPEMRAGVLFRAAEQMRRQRFELAALEVIEVGKTWKDADGDVAEAIDYLEYYGREMIRLGRPRILGDYPGEENEYRYIPRGIGVVIAPWNFPLAIATGMTSAAVVTGNCAIFKPSGLSPVIGYKMCELFGMAGLPPGVLQFLPGPGSDIGEYLVSHPAVDFIAFTGSKDVGLRIMQIAGETGQGRRNIKKVIAELGGKNAVIVDETADLDEAVKGIVESAFGYQGQKCSACSRLIVLEEVVEELCSRLTEAVSSIEIGPPEDPKNSMGPVIDEAAFRRIKAYIETGKQEGRVIFERKIEGEGWFVGPVIFIDAKPGSRIATEEIFGPVLTIMRAGNIDEAIRIANESPYALTGGLFSRSPENIKKVKEQFRAGNLYINRKITGALVGRQPFGGFGMSGVGSKAGGPDYLLQFMNAVSISENTIRRGFAPLEKEADES